AREASGSALVSGALPVADAVQRSHRLPANSTIYSKVGLAGGTSNPRFLGLHDDVGSIYHSHETRSLEENRSKSQPHGLVCCHLPRLERHGLYSSWSIQGCGDEDDEPREVCLQGRQGQRCPVGPQSSISVVV